MKYRCKVCGWVSEDVSTKPEKCPICGAEAIEEVVEGNKTYATEHKIGDGIVEDKEIKVKLLRIQHRKILNLEHLRNTVLVQVKWI